MPEHEKCEECGERTSDVQRMPDPYAENANGQIWMRDLCEDDAQKRFNES